jgi:hypothetical protein
MTKYVIGPDVAIRLAHDQAVIGDEHQILASTLLRGVMVGPLRCLPPGEQVKSQRAGPVSHPRARGVRTR